MSFISRRLTTYTGLRTIANTCRVRSRRAMWVDVEALEGRALMAALQFSGQSLFGHVTFWPQAIATGGHVGPLDGPPEQASLPLFTSAHGAASASTTDVNDGKVNIDTLMFSDFTQDGKGGRHYTISTIDNGGVAEGDTGGGGTGGGTGTGGTGIGTTAGSGLGTGGGTGTGTGTGGAGTGGSGSSGGGSGGTDPGYPIPAALITGPVGSSITATVVPTEPFEKSGDPVKLLASSDYSGDGFPPGDSGYLDGFDSQYVTSFDVTSPKGQKSSYTLLNASGFDPQSKELPPLTLHIGDVITIHYLLNMDGAFRYFRLKTEAFTTSLDLNFDLPGPTVKVDDVEFGEANSDIAYHYETTGNTGPITVGLFFSPTPTYNPATAKPVIDPTTNEAATDHLTPGPDQPKTQRSFTFATAPANPSQLPYLLAVADPNDPTTPDDPSRVASLQLPNITVTDLEWHPDTESTWKANPTTAGGVDFTYTISGADLPKAAPIALYWATGPDVQDIIPGQTPTTLDDDLNPLETETAQGTYHVHIAAARLSTPPQGKGTTYLLVVADPGDPKDELHPNGTIIESDKSDNVDHLDASPDSILSNSVHVTPDGSKIDAVFMPEAGNSTPVSGEAEGALTIAQAAAICDVDHFNWDQTFQLPASWQADYVVAPIGYYELQPSLPNSTLQAFPNLATLKNGSIVLFNDANRNLELDPGEEVLKIADSHSALSQLLPGSPITDPLPQPFPPVAPQALPPSVAFVVIDYAPANPSASLSFANSIALPDWDPKVVGWQPPDNLPYYYNEGNGIESRYVPDFNDPNAYEITFHDNPSVGKGRYDSNQKTSFVTRLVGVLDNDTHQEKTLTGSNIAFSWTSNGENAGDLAYFFDTDQDLQPPVVSGGVSDVRFINTPPPVLPTVSSPVVSEGESIRLNLHAVSSANGSPLTYGLDPSSPPGVAIDPRTGVLTWAVPGSEPPGVYPVTVRVTDQSSPPLSTTTTFLVTVKDVPPAVSLGPAVSLMQGSTLSKAGSFSAPGAGPWTATVDYGDGTGARPLALNANKTFTLSHAYARPGTYTARVVVTDPYGGAGTGHLTVTVNAQAPLPSPVPTPAPLTPSGFGAGRDAFVTSLYLDDLGALPDPAGLRYWSGQLAAGVSDATVAASLWAVGEMQFLQRQRTAPPVTPLQAYVDASLAARRAGGLYGGFPLGPARLLTVPWFPAWRPWPVA